MNAVRCESSLSWWGGTWWWHSEKSSEGRYSLGLGCADCYQSVQPPWSLGQSQINTCHVQLLKIWHPPPQPPGEEWSYTQPSRPVHTALPASTHLPSRLATRTTLSRSLRTCSSCNGGVKIVPVNKAQRCGGCWHRGNRTSRKLIS